MSTHLSGSRHLGNRSALFRNSPITELPNYLLAFRRAALVAVIGLALAACAGPQPILYPNEHFKRVGEERSKQDIAECRQMAETAGATAEEGKTARTAKSTAVGGGVGAAAGAVGGAIVGAAGTGAAIGAASGATAGLIRGLFSSSQPSGAYVEFVNRCLVDRGYEPVGWE